MLTVERAIEEVGHMENISKHTSTKCFDFGDEVLLLYVSKNVNVLARDDAESAMEKANYFADMGVNTPRYYGIKRVEEGDFNYCYILQDKAKGKPCCEICDFDEIKVIPQQHYNKLAFDLCALKNLGIEAYKTSNLFYDAKSGFWIIDLCPGLSYAEDMTDDRALEQMVDFGISNALFFSLSQDAYEQLALIERGKREVAKDTYMNSRGKSFP